MHRQIARLCVSDTADKRYFPEDTVGVVTNRFRRVSVPHRAHANPRLLADFDPPNRSRRHPNDDLQLLGVNDAANLRAGRQRLTELTSQAIQNSIDWRTKCEQVEL
jgi:hypothetical protein